MIKKIQRIYNFSKKEHGGGDEFCPYRLNAELDQITNTLNYIINEIKKQQNNRPKKCDDCVFFKPNHGCGYERIFRNRAVGDPACFDGIKNANNS